MGRFDYFNNNNPNMSLKAPYDLWEDCGSKLDTISEQYPFRLLNTNYSKNESKARINQCRDIINDVFKKHGVGAYVVGHSVGSSQIRFEVQIDDSVKTADVERLKDNLKMKLKVENISIENPVLKKDVMGIVIPRETINTISLKEVLQDYSYPSLLANYKLKVCLGKDLDNNLVLVDIADMPHLLIAGSTGGGKSVCVNNIIMNLLYNYSPAYLNLILVDLKQVELNQYNYIPHLLKAIVSDKNNVLECLDYVRNEVQRRYSILKDNNVKNIEKYNEKLEIKMPYIVVIIDEFAQMKSIPGVDVEEYFEELVEVARAAGVHFILATQTPTADVISTRIKNNMPGRIALTVTNWQLSKVILDEVGAEELNGKGDMYYKLNNKMIRLQGTYIEDDEIQRVCEYLAVKKEENETYFDDLIKDVFKFFDSEGRASKTSIINRFGVGSSRALKIIRQLQQLGALGMTTAKGNEILMTYEEFERGLTQ